MFYWTRYRYHGNTAGSKPALNNGFDLYSENPVVRFFPSFVSRKLKKTTGLLTLVSLNFDRDLLLFVFCILTFSEHVLCQISIFVCRRAKRVPNYYSTKFLWNYNDRFRRNQYISTKSCSHNFLVNCACATFDRILDLSRSIQTIPERQGIFQEYYL